MGSILLTHVATGPRYMPANEPGVLARGWLDVGDNKELIFYYNAVIYG